MRGLCRGFPRPSCSSAATAFMSIALAQDEAAVAYHGSRHPAHVLRTSGRLRLAEKLDLVIAAFLCLRKTQRMIALRSETSMNNDLRACVSDLPVVDVHEHHMPDLLGNRDVGLLTLLQQSYAGWTQARPYPLPSETRFEDPMLASVGPGSWDEIAKFVEHSGSNSFVRNLIRALTELYDLDEDGITPENWRRLDADIRRRHCDDTWRDEVLNRARIERIITDPFNNPLLNAQRRWENGTARSCASMR